MIKKTILLVDVGNSSAKWCLANSSNDLGDMQNQQYSESINRDFFINAWANLDKPEKVIVSCVAKEPVWLILQQACEQLWALQAEKMSSVKEGWGLINAYKKPDELGCDRWCGMIGAYDELHSDLMVVDCGSALTIDVVKASGEHIGGYISPGLSMMKKSLAADTADVQVDFTLSAMSELSLSPANSTASCVDSAIILSTVKLIESVFVQQQNEMQKLQCILTGGDAALVGKLLSIKCSIMPNLVIRGLAQIAFQAKNTNNQEFLCR